ncbi:MAG: guanylate kinase [Candidatus Ancillula trichonymphae]|jgi:guanylate kinase|nr:guanylate kinase [Candidatus Ancillula trichonymphae]
MSTPDLTVLAGPTAVGKGTISRRLIELYPEVYLSISTTTRSPRENEQDGVHYHFLTLTDFDAKIKNNEFLEWAVVHGMHKYGTLREPIEQAQQNGLRPLLEIDSQGARILRETVPGAKFLFLAPPSFEELITRLGIRGTESVEDRIRRLDTAKQDLASQDEFDHIIVNDDVEDAVKELAGLMNL